MGSRTAAVGRRRWRRCECEPAGAARTSTNTAAGDGGLRAADAWRLQQRQVQLPARRRRRMGAAAGQRRWRGRRGRSGGPWPAQGRNAMRCEAMRRSPRHRSTDRPTDRPIDGWIDRRTDGRTDGWSVGQAAVDAWRCSRRRRSPLPLIGRPPPPMLLPPLLPLSPPLPLSAAAGPVAAAGGRRLRCGQHGRTGAGCGRPPPSASSTRRPARALLAVRTAAQRRRRRRGGRSGGRRTGGRAHTECRVAGAVGPPAAHLPRGRPCRPAPG